MSLMRAFSPELRQMVRRLDDVLGPSALSRLSRRGWDIMEDQSFSPISDVHETDDKFVIETELPGVDKKDVKMELADESTLVIRGEVDKVQGSKKDGRFLNQERTFGSFTRSFSLPTKIKEDSMKAEMKNGLLRIEVPKAETSQKVLNIEWKDDQ